MTPQELAASNYSAVLANQKAVEDQLAKDKISNVKVEIIPIQWAVVITEEEDNSGNTNSGNNQTSEE